MVGVGSDGQVRDVILDLGPPVKHTRRDDDDVTRFHRASATALIRTKDRWAVPFSIVTTGLSAGTSLALVNAPPVTRVPEPDRMT